MNPTAKVSRFLVAALATGAALLTTAASAQAGAADFSFTPEKYSRLPFGTAKADAWEQLGGALSRPGSADGWCEDSGRSITCWTTSSDYAPYGTFSFTEDGKLWKKHHEGLYEPTAPSIRLAHYNQVQVGMTEAQLWSVVPRDSCVLQDEGYPNWPATDGRIQMYWCDASTGLFPPNARFYLTDGTVTAKYQRSLT
ncbi:BLIP family protein [Streptomyces sp. B93]|uniref:BLIP family protein n=1 Tax=Streptomyces sp. B93 TaxID=2824875 RepID=UPI001B358228|nr:BLIP family protein [Streptomyces sp. B93]MBQ1092070.1 BLIP family protein [Streptomyces sp. B93]